MDIGALIIALARVRGDLGRLADQCDAEMDGPTAMETVYLRELVRVLMLAEHRFRGLRGCLLAFRCGLRLGWLAWRARERAPRLETPRPPWEP